MRPEDCTQKLGALVLTNRLSKSGQSIEASYQSKDAKSEKNVEV